MSLSVPAWKRLGLKLKYAKDEPDSSDTSGIHRTPTRGSQVTDGHEDDRPRKRQRVGKTDDGETNGSSIRTSPLMTGTINGHSSPWSADQVSYATVQRTPKRQKSVTFSNDTKALDGDSRVTIDFPAGSPGSTPYKAKQPRDTINPSSGAANGTSEDIADAELAKPKKRKSPSAKKSKPSQPDGKGKTDSALPYLIQHRHNKNSWKFNKNRDVWIISHALDAEAIPLSHVLALAGYVKGLPEKAAARQRLIEQCKNSMALMENGIVPTNEDQKKFLSLLDDLQVGDDLQHDFLNQIPRPIMLLWSLGENIEDVRNSKLPDTSTVVSQPLVERKRKSRTAVPVDLSSSESESESESSDSESDDEEPGAKVTNGVKVNGGADETSSSGTDSSDSDADSSSSDDSDSD